MDALVLFLWAEELGPALIGRRIVESGSSREWRYHIGLDDGRWLLLSLERDLAALFVDHRPPGRLTGGLPAAMADGIGGATIRAIAAVPGERVLHVASDRGDLYVEFFPSHPTLVWAVESDVVAIHRNGRVRTDHLAVGSRYAPPPSDRPHPGLTRKIGLALGANDVPWTTIVERARASARAFVTKPSDRHLVSPVEIPGAPITADETTINEAVRAAFLLNLADARHRREAAAWRSRVVGARKRLARTASAVARDLKQAESWPIFERMGSSLLASPHLVPRGATSVTVPDVFDEEGGLIEIAIDPRVSVAENAAGYLKRANRGKRGLPQIEERMRTLDADVEWIADRESLPADRWTDEERAHLADIETRHRLRSRTQKAAPRRRAEDGPSFHPRRFISSDGWTILVGRSNAENDWLSLKYARGDDTWLHAQGVTGSHVLIRREGRRDNPSQRTLREAAGLAATYSKARHSAHVSVVYTRAKYVRKPRKAPPGLVTCTREKSIMVEPIDPKSLAAEDAPERSG